MAIKVSDTDDARRKIDEQDRLDAEEIMVNAMASTMGTNTMVSTLGSNSSLGSMTSINSTSNQRRVRPAKIPARPSISSKRRTRAPAIPPPYNNMTELIPQRKWNLHKAFSICVATVAVTGAIAVSVIHVVHRQSPPSFVTTAAPVILVDKPVRLREVPSQNHRIQHTKYAGSEIPSFFQVNVKNFEDGNHYGEVPVLWRIPFSGDEAWTEIMGSCMKFTQAADEQELLGVHLADSELKYVATPKGVFFNLDLSQWDGVEQAKAINLAALDRVDIIASPILSVLSLFDDLTLQGRAFCTLRHPAARAVSLYYGFKDVNSRYYDPAIVDVTIEKYAAWPGDRHEFNFMVKSLVSSGTELISSAEIVPEDLELAKSILEQKFMILLADDKFGSWTKLQSWMGWPFSTQEQRKCEDAIIKKEWPQITHKQPPMGANEAAYSLLAERNSWDLQLYEYAAHIFEKQTEGLVK